MLPPTVNGLPQVILISVKTHQQPEHIPEQQGHTREERKRSCDMLAGLVAVDEVAGIVEDRPRGEDDHHCGKPQSQRDGKYERSHNQAECDEPANFEKSSEKAEIADSFLAGLDTVDIFPDASWLTPFNFRDCQPP